MGFRFYSLSLLYSTPISIHLKISNRQSNPNEKLKKYLYFCIFNSKKYLLRLTILAYSFKKLSFVAFHKAGKITEALLVLQQLMNNAINENRFNDASYYCWILSMQCLDLAKDSTADQQNIHLKRYRDLSKKADIYYAYHNIHRYIVSLQIVFRYLFNKLS